MLVVVHHGDVQFLFQAAFDFETLGSFDVFQVDSTEGRGNHFDRFDEFVNVFRVYLDIEYIDVGEYFK